MSNTLGRSVRLFLVDGKATGLITAEIMNWTGHVLTGPRADLPGTSTTYAAWQEQQIQVVEQTTKGSNVFSAPDSPE